MNILSLLKSKYPENSGYYQCGTYAHLIVDFPSVGDSYSQKKKAVQNYGILKQNLAHYQVGDVIISDEGTFMGFGHGHVCVVLDPSNLTVAEANFRNDQRVHYGRKIDPKHIYGVIRGNFKLLPYPDSITLKTTIFMQYQKPWNSAIFQEFADRVSTLTNGKIKLDIYPEYTYYSLKNWWYLAYFQNYNVIAREYIDQIVDPLVFPGSQFALWSINKQQWEGSVLDSPNLQEVGWFYPNSRHALIVCEEGEMSFKNYGIKAFVDIGFHELSHFLYDFGRADQRDYCHTHWDANQMEKVIGDIDLKRLTLNI